VVIANCTGEREVDISSAVVLKIRVDKFILDVVRS
jgi:hypothetical protein